MIDTFFDTFNIERENEKFPLISISGALFQSKEATGFFDQSSKHFWDSKSQGFKKSADLYSNHPESATLA